MKSMLHPKQINLKEQITAQKDEKVLRTWLKLAAKAGSIEEFTGQLSM